MRLLVLVLVCFALSEVHAGFDDAARYAFLSSWSEKTVYVIDLYDRKKAGEIPLAEAPNSVAASEALKAAIVSHRDAKKLTLIDLTSDDLQQIDYPLDIRPDQVLVSPIGETVAILDQSVGELQVHALKRAKILVSVKNVSTASTLTFSPDGSTVYWVDQQEGILHAVDLWSERKQLQLAREGAALSAMSRSIDGTLGFVSNAENGSVNVVNLRTFNVLRTSRVGNEPERPWGTADGQYMLVPNAGSSTVTAMSAATSEALYTARAVSNPVSINAGWIDTIVAVVGGDGAVAFLSIDDGSELARTELDGDPEEGIVTSDSKTLAIPVPGSGSIVFFDMKARVHLSTISGLPDDIGPAALAVSNNLCH